jgi:excisionase family DNA binding protein|tara:strand:- start:4335 stop:4676 length:342 start_codon:yes stop_codon:yes gene_type:complete
MATLTPNEAAKVAHVSRGTIMKAIKDDKIKAKRTNISWQIERDSLDIWIAGRVGVSVLSGAMARDDSTLSELTGIRTENAVLIERLASKDDLISRLESEVEYLRQPFWKRFLK